MSSKFWIPCSFSLVMVMIATVTDVLYLLEAGGESPLYSSFGCLAIPGKQIKYDPVVCYLEGQPPSPTCLLSQHSSAAPQHGKGLTMEPGNIFLVKLNVIFHLFLVNMFYKFLISLGNIIHSSKH